MRNILHSHAHADASMVKTILRNLLANGIKFSQPGGDITVQAEKTGDSIRLSVSDEGVAWTEIAFIGVVKIHCAADDCWGLFKLDIELVFN